jgi:hypothetical protein
MKVYYLLFLIVSFNLYSQKKTYACEDIKKITDFKIYDTLSNGKLIARFDKVVNQKIYKITFENNGFTYVTKSLMKQIKKSIKKNKCKGIIIRDVDKKNDVNIKITR